MVMLMVIMVHGYDMVLVMGPGMNGKGHWKDIDSL